MSCRPAIITGVGSYLPDRILTNEDLSEIVDTNDEWIVSHTGISERRIAAEDQASSDLGLIAAQRALDDAGLQPSDLDMILTPTVTSDQVFPSTACMIQDKLGAPNTIAAFDLVSGCTGFVMGLSVAAQFIESGSMNNILVVSAEKLTSVTDWTDRSTCILFGDGAGAAVMSAGEGERGETGLLAYALETYGEHGRLLRIPAGGSRQPITPELVASHDHCIRMEGPELFKLAVRGIPEIAKTVISKAGLTSEDIDWVIMHQANLRIIEAAAKRLHIPEDRVIINVDKYGNTSAASMAIALDEVYSEGKLKSGDNLLLVGFGAGFTLGGAVIRWA